MRIKFLLILLAFTFLVGTVMAEEEAGILGLPFPDFSAVDTEGNTFTLSEALKDQEAAFRGRQCLPSPSQSTTSLKGWLSE